MALLSYAEFAKRERSDAFHIRNGGAYFSSLATHPGKGIPPNSSAAGAYQITLDTYNDAVKNHVVHDFTERSQKAIVHQILRHTGALAYIWDGKLDATFALLNRKWSSLPGGASPQITAAEAKHYFWSRLKEEPS